jgi:hypothetical protein
MHFIRLSPVSIVKRGMSSSGRCLEIIIKLPVNMYLSIAPALLSTSIEIKINVY